ncbi:hypothetical protein GCM10022409_28980 [Hymenobacter glaciei]|uniref:Uncharacterized protein n=1 Tax=Hymenobacter glaciei TaxID=877209 RepID=A0ABP7UE15_9BACT
MNFNDIVDNLVRSFDHEPHPGEANIVYDNSGYHLEAQAIRQAFTPFTWQAMPPELLHEEQSCLGFLSRAGFKYYLPAFMRLALTDYHRADMIPDNLVFSLTLPIEADIIASAIDIKRDQMDEKMPGVDWNDILQSQLQSLNQSVHEFIARAALFNSDQGRVIYQFLAHLRDEHSDDFLNQEPAVAIQRYWFQFA